MDKVMIETASDHMLTILVHVPTYGTPSQDIATASQIRQNLQTGLHARVKVDLVLPSEEGWMETYQNVPVPEYEHKE